VRGADEHIQLLADSRIAKGLQVCQQQRSVFSLFGDQYLVANFVDGRPEGGRIAYVKIFSGVAVFILVIACLNFMNLATARSVKRAKEVGVRKVIGSSRGHLIGQFFGESLLLSFIALLISTLLIFLLLPIFNDYTGKHIGTPIK